MPIQTTVEAEKMARINVCVWAYAYEVAGVSLVPDSQFDLVCSEIDLSISTNSPKLDKWFRKHFNPSTGYWIHKHPEISRLKEIFEAVTRKT